ncbi:MAG: hypothetical protein QW303_04910 [Nitrososphaerota archaeon]
MKIDLVLTASNINDHYIHLYPLVHRVWKEKFNLDCYLILVADKIPDFLETYGNHIILFKPIAGLNTIFIAQVVRILYPALYENKNILITDVDIFPISYEYFIDPILSVPENNFVSYRNKFLNRKMVSICYNLANSNTWKEIFQIKKMDDVITLLKMWYDDGYTGEKNCKGWFTDQIKLFEYLDRWRRSNIGRWTIFDDRELNFCRLDKRQRSYIIHNYSRVKEDLRNKKFTDFHSIKPYSKYKYLIEEIVDIICSIK